MGQHDQNIQLHHKICLIDQLTIINGSYNWSYSACNNEENIMILTIEANNSADSTIIESIYRRHGFLCKNGSQRIDRFETLGYYQTHNRDFSITLSKLDEHEIELRKLFQDRITETFHKAQGLKLGLSDEFLRQMVREGGGVNFVKRILRDEMRTNEVKSGFMKLVLLTPPRLDLSLEFQVLQPEFGILFSEEEKAFCQKLVGWGGRGEMPNMS
ncbi:phospholipase D-like domain-containing protein [Chitinophaga horti]|uniref:Phospholipase D-like domain-containing protein n=1 Tax=Chitinophaga horti TaxID=2920382 RepID=A0ABY6J2C0_9BACT|nr:phospholipase D-like domain-containing protein [Chitinophaga horti]UYQ93814.1 phospholipase D-like domain-containing protein [Chitinophaga horti]